MDQRVVMSRSEEREWRDQGASAYAGDHIELRAGSGSAPRRKHADAEGASRTTAGDHEDIEAIRLGCRRPVANASRRDPSVVIYPDLAIAGDRSLLCFSG